MRGPRTEEPDVTTSPRRTLTGAEYRAPDVYAAEVEQIFARNWMYVGRADLLVDVGDRLVADVAGESVLVVRDRDGRLHAHHNVCRHRGSVLCDESGRGHGAAISCPYHAFSYSLDGALVATPNVPRDELDRAAMSLWPVAVDEWQGFVFVNVDRQARPLVAWLSAHDDGPRQFERHTMGALRTVEVTVTEVRANWKILFENYAECLHCPRVHPELVELVPLYRSGAVTDPDRDDGGVTLAGQANSFSLGGPLDLPVLRGMGGLAGTSYFGAAVFPSMFIDITGTSVIVTRIVPRAADHCTVFTEYLFPAEAVERDDFDATGIVAFSELVAAQDYRVCAGVQRGVSSRAFTTGVYAEKDALAHAFSERYRREMRTGGRAGSAATPTAPDLP
jgi:Rieske 2Fe-2S family protein